MFTKRNNIVLSVSSKILPVKIKYLLHFLKITKEAIILMTLKNELMLNELIN